MSSAIRILVRRCLVLAALLFWQGGFTFYAAVVVPLGRRLIGSHFSDVTQQVSNYLNLSGAVFLLLMAWDAWATRSGKWVWLAWFVLVATLGVLVWMHPHMDALMDANEYAALKPWHRVYLWTSTGQWFVVVGYVPLLIRGWQREDRHEEDSQRQTSRAAPS
jgi:hypothetical protein